MPQLIYNDNSGLNNFHDIMIHGSLNKPLPIEKVFYQLVILFLIVNEYLFMFGNH